MAAEQNGSLRIVHSRSSLPFRDQLQPRSNSKGSPPLRAQCVLPKSFCPKHAARRSFPPRPSHLHQVPLRLTHSQPMTDTVSRGVYPPNPPVQVFSQVVPVCEPTHTGCRLLGPWSGRAAARPARFRAHTQNPTDSDRAERAAPQARTRPSPIAGARPTRRRPAQRPPLSPVSRSGLLTARETRSRPAWRDAQLVQELPNGWGNGFAGLGLIGTVNPSESSQRSTTKRAGGGGRRGGGWRSGGAGRRA